MTTKLDRLNTLLKHTDVPDFRKKVTPSFSNLKWLRRVLADDDTTNVELRTLLKLDPKSLLTAYENATAESRT